MFALTSAAELQRRGATHLHLGPTGPSGYLGSGKQEGSPSWYVADQRGRWEKESNEVETMRMHL